MQFHHTSQNITKFKTYELFIYGSFYLIFLDHGWPQITETVQSETANEKEPLYKKTLHFVKCYFSITVDTQYYFKLVSSV